MDVEPLDGSRKSGSTGPASQRTWACSDPSHLSRYVALSDAPRCGTSLPASCRLPAPPAVLATHYSAYQVNGPDGKNLNILGFKLTANVVAPRFIILWSLVQVQH